MQEFCWVAPSTLQDLQVATHTFTFTDAVNILSAATGTPSSYQQLSLPPAHSLPTSAAAMASLFCLGEHAKWLARRDHVKVVGQGPGLEEWAQQHRDEIIQCIGAGLAGK